MVNVANAVRCTACSVSQQQFPAVLSIVFIMFFVTIHLRYNGCVDFAICSGKKYSHPVFDLFLLNALRSIIE